ncbi:MAG TPA: DUF6807 family protein, partial [Gemmataceae bacterium]|nr:DUF6807 family protein [Gemmataceae bacterium]
MYRHKTWVNGFAVHEKGFASASSDGTVGFISGDMSAKPVFLEGGAGEVRCVAFSPDGKQLAAGNRYGTVRIWDVASRKEVKTITGHMGEVWSIAFSPDGKTLAAVDTEWKKPSKVKLYDTTTWKERGSLACPGEILCIAYSPKGDWLAAGSWDKTVRVFPLAAKVGAPPKPAPRVQAVPQPYDQVSFQRDGVEIARFHFGTTLKRPFVFPLIGPSGRSLTRMGHPHDPISHSHHNSVWISHNDVNGVTFWGDTGKNTGRIVHQRVEKLTDGDAEASVTSVNAWIEDATKKTLLTERRKTTVQTLDKGEWLLILDLQFDAKNDVTLGKSPFGMIGVRMAKSIG